MNWNLGLIGLAAFAVLSSRASADNFLTGGGYLTGNQLWQICGLTTIGEPPNFCAGYVSGVIDGVNQGDNVVTTSPMANEKICVPIHSTANQAADVVRQWLSAHPEYRHYSAPSLVIISLRATFPCPKMPGG